MGAVNKSKTFSAVSLSGGKDSSALLLLMIEKGLPIDCVLYADTGMEFPEMEAHIAKLDDFLYQERSIHITTLRHLHGFEWLMFERPVNRAPGRSPLVVGLLCGAALRLAVYTKGKNAKKYRHGMEYGTARWGNSQDIAPYIAPKFEDNIILTQTERLSMNSRPKDPKTARNKNVLVIGGSGSGKTRFFLKPNLTQCTSDFYPTSFVVTDPKGSL